MRRLLFSVLAWLFFPLVSFSQEANPKSPVTVKIQDEKPVVVNVEPTGPIDPVKRINFNPAGQFNLSLNVEGKTLQNGAIHNMFHYNGRPMGANRVETARGPLPKSASGKEREGFISVYGLDKLRITQTVEVIATKPPTSGAARRRDAVLVRYTVENKDTISHKLGMRSGMDVYLVDNDGALFAAPTHPGKVLDGIEFRDKTVPDYLQILQRPLIKAPGFVAHMTFNLGGGLEKPNRVVCTGLGANANDGWHVNPQPSNGDSAMYWYWDVRELKPGTKREMGYAYGQGQAYGLQNAGNFRVELGGSFEIGKIFSITAHIVDPAPGQSIHLELPPGMQLLEGREIEPVPATGDLEETLVLWKARVLRSGVHTIRLVSSNGITLGKIVSITENR